MSQQQPSIIIAIISEKQRAFNISFILLRKILADYIYCKPEKVLICHILFGHLVPHHDTTTGGVRLICTPLLLPHPIHRLTTKRQMLLVQWQRYTYGYGSSISSLPNTFMLVIVSCSRCLLWFPLVFLWFFSSLEQPPLAVADRCDHCNLLSIDPRLHTYLPLLLIFKI